jgi:hypothetical protein
LYIPTRGSRRVNVPIPYPGSRQLDQWLPIALPAISFLWIVLQVFVSNSSGAAWTSWIRLLVVLLAFFAIVLPIGWISVNIAAAQGKFHLPPNARLRTIAAFSLPTAIAAFLYLSLGSFSSAIPGVVLGAAVAMGAAWLLLRVKPAETAVTLMATGSAFAIAVLIAGFLMLAVNGPVQSSAQASGTQLAESPLGPGLPWVTKPVEKKEKHKGSSGIDVVAPTAPVSQEPNPDSNGSAKPQATSGTSVVTSGDSTVPETAPSPAPVAATPPVQTPAPVSQPAPKKEENAFAGLIFGPKELLPQKKPSTEEEDPDPALPPEPATNDPKKPAGPAAVPADYAAAAGDPVAFAILAAKPAIVSSVRKTTAIGSFERLVPALTTSNIVLIVKHGDRADLDYLETWDLMTPKKIASTSIKRDTTAPIAAIAGTPTYACSADGKQWARITSFPKLSLEVSSFAGDEAPLRIPLVTEFGEASVVGFASPSRVLVRYQKEEMGRLEVWDIKSRKFVVQNGLPPAPANAANGVLSPDGQQFASVGMTRIKGASHGTLVVFDATTPAMPRIVQLTGIDDQRAVHPTGMAFSADGKRLGILYEQAGNTVLLSYAMPAVTPLPPIAAPAGKVTGGANESLGGRLTSVAGGKAWLVGGNAVIDADSGKLLGELGLESPVMHAPMMSAAGEILLIGGDLGDRRLTLVGLKK